MILRVGAITEMYARVKNPGAEIETGMRRAEFRHAIVGPKMRSTFHRGKLEGVPLAYTFHVCDKMFSAGLEQRSCTVLWI